MMGFRSLTLPFAPHTMRRMKTRRSILWVVSIGFGLVSTAGTIIIFGSDLNRFWTNFLFIGDLPLLLLIGYFSLAFIWLDLILQTQYLKN